MNHTINEWQDMSLRKDVQQISKELQNRKSLEKPLLLEIYIGIISLIFDKFLDLVNSPKMDCFIGPLCKCNIYFVILIMGPLEKPQRTAE